MEREKEDMYMLKLSVFIFNEKEMLGTILKFTNIVIIFTKGRITSHFPCPFFLYLF